VSEASVSNPNVVNGGLVFSCGIDREEKRMDRILSLLIFHL